MLNDTNNETSLLCSNDFPSTDQLYKVISKDIAVVTFTAISACCTLITICIYIEEVLFLYRHYKHKSKRARICSILALYPVISFTSMLILLVPRSTLIGEFVAAVFLGFCIIQFVALTVEYFGSSEEMLKDFEGEDISFRTPPCCCCCFCLTKIKFTKPTFKVIRFMVLQIAVVRPVILFIAAVLWTDGRYDPGNELNPQSSTLYITIINVTSVVFAMYGNRIIYGATADRLKNFRLRFKFAALILAIMLIHLQNSIMSIFGKFGLPHCSGIGSSMVRSTRTNHFLLTYEMFLLAILARFAYRRVDTDEYVVKPNHHSNENGENISNDAGANDSVLPGKVDTEEIECNIQDTGYINQALEVDNENSKVKEV